MKRGADIDELDSIGQTALIIASKNGNAKATALMLHPKASLSAKGPYGNAIQSATLMGHEETVKTLLYSGFNADAAVGVHGTSSKSLLEKVMDVSQRCF